MADDGDSNRFRVIVGAVGIGLIVFPEPATTGTGLVLLTSSIGGVTGGTNAPEPGQSQLGGYDGPQREYGDDE